MTFKTLLTCILFCCLPHVGNAQSLVPDLERANGEAEYRAILDAISSDDIEAVLETKDANGDTPLMLAAKTLDLTLFDLLVAYGANPNVRDAESRDILNIAIRKSSPILARHALAAGTDPQVFTTRYQGSTLIFASDRGEVDIVKMLIEAGAPLDRINRLGWTALLEATVLGDGGAAHQQIVRLLLDAGADPKIADRDGITPYEHAVRRGHTKLAEIFLSRN